jgi:hypothetical protein
MNLISLLTNYECKPQNIGDFMDATTVSIQDYGVKLPQVLNDTGAIDNYNYLITLLDNTGNRSIMDTPLHPVFGDPEAFAKLTRPEINKGLFEFINSQAEPTIDASEFKLALVEATKDVDIFHGDNISDVRKRCRQAYDKTKYTRNKAKEAYDNYLAHIRTLATNEENHEAQKAVLQALKNSDDNLNHALLDAVAEVVAAGDWLYLGKGVFKIDRYRYSTDYVPTDAEDIGGFTDEEIESVNEWPEEDDIGNRIYYPTKLIKDGTMTFGGNEHIFISTKPIVTRQVNPAAGINESYDCGHMIVTMTKHGLISQAAPVLGHRSNGAMSHPHVSRTSICWGDVFTPMEQNANKQDYSMLTALNMFKNLLETYNAADPYCTVTQLNRYAHHFPDHSPCALPYRFLKTIPEGLMPDMLKPAYEEGKAVYGLIDSYTDYDLNRHATDEFIGNPENRTLVTGLAGKAYDIYNGRWDNNYGEQALMDYMEREMYIVDIETLRKFHRVNLYTACDHLSNNTKKRAFRALLLMSLRWHELNSGENVNMYMSPYSDPDIDTVHEFARCDEQRGSIDNMNGYCFHETYCYFKDPTSGVGRSSMYARKTRYIFMQSAEGDNNETS